MNGKQPNNRTLYVLVALFFLCAGVLVFLGLQTDASMRAGLRPSAGGQVAAAAIMAAAAIGGVLLGFMIYFLPTLVAWDRRHRERTPIFLVNLFFGWSVLGWIIAFIWSFTSQVDQPSTSDPQPAARP